MTALLIGRLWKRWVKDAVEVLNVRVEGSCQFLTSELQFRSIVEQVVDHMSDELQWMTLI